MAEALLRYRLTAREVPGVRVHSAGLMKGGAKATQDTIATLADRGVDASRHHSRQITLEMLGAADLVVAMARGHVREAVLQVPDLWPRAFTLSPNSGNSDTLCHQTSMRTRDAPGSLRATFASTTAGWRTLQPSCALSRASPREAFLSGSLRSADHN